MGRGSNSLGICVEKMFAMLAVMNMSQQTTTAANNDHNDNNSKAAAATLSSI